MNGEILEEKEGLTVKLIQDEDALNPRTDYDNFGTMVCFHRRYNLGDKHNFNSPEDFQEWWKDNGGKKGVLLNLYLYDHSGITISCAPFSCPWDSGQVGWIYATEEMIRKEYGKRITKNVQAKTEKLLTCEVETYDQFLTGDVWGYSIKDEEGECLDSCWGFYGSDYAKKEALSQFKYYVEKAEAERTHLEAVETMEDCTP